MSRLQLHLGSPRSTQLGLPLQNQLNHLAPAAGRIPQILLLEPARRMATDSIKSRVVIAVEVVGVGAMENSVAVDEVVEGSAAMESSEAVDVEDSEEVVEMANSVVDVEEEVVGTVKAVDVEDRGAGLKLSFAPRRAKVAMTGRPLLCSVVWSFP